MQPFPESTASCEVSWFSALCDDDYEFLGVPQTALQSSWEHCRDIVLSAETGGFDRILLPSGYSLGLDTIAFAGGVAPMLRRLKLLTAIRCGEVWPPQQARQIATLDQMTEGRLDINIISSDLPGETLESAPRYRRTLEYMHILRALLNGQPVDIRGEFYNLSVPPPRLGGYGGKSPLFYFGGLSEAARETAAAAADVYLMWPDTLDRVRSIVNDMRARAARHGRTLRFGYRIHMIVRDTEAESRAAASRLVSRLDASAGASIRSRSLDTATAGVIRQGELRDKADSEGYVEDILWTGVGRARSGCGAALVGTPDQIIAKLRAYQDLGMGAFILSGYPHQSECDLVARHVLPHLNHAPLSRFN
ncbi:LLM class flavin-dependent oxidoreductase [Asaia sp. As-1742]|uniref:LLM class flavin-dependent oxidoreductase n=1 Tax=Asaia sp. As-1742 TaxID=2608325 RepID=UPI001420BC34|nr:LLM class flavin-dependent oxidoreductase [Asaia sp. As-1742]NIE81565.1 LLM class flavin-dependent oxidoreductase [Asaia sp. As-1742]